VSFDVGHSLLQTPLVSSEASTIDSAPDRSARPRVIVVVAARDEAVRIGETLSALVLAAPGARVWVADDGSRDATARIAGLAGARVVHSARGTGKGGAVTAAARAALAHLAATPEAPAAGAGAEGEARAAGRTGAADGEARAAGRTGAADGEGEPVFLLCDADLEQSARELGALVDAVAAGGADVAVGVFATRAGGGLGLALGFARWAIRRRCGLHTRAPISGQRALSAGALGDVLPFAHGYGMEVGMTIDAVRAGHRVIELELDLAHRASGRTAAGFAHRARQLADVARAYCARA
jgi:glycosyltransferase involved in cell wall biosynthesis